QDDELVLLATTEQATVPTTARQAWKTLAGSLPTIDNPHGHDEDAQGAVEVGTPEATELMTTGAPVRWELHPDGTLWLVPGPSTRAQVPAAGTATFTMVDGRLTGTRLTVHNPDRSPYGDASAEDRALAALAEAAFARHGVTFGGAGDGTTGPGDGPAAASGGTVGVGDVDRAREAMSANARDLDAVASPMNRERFSHMPRGPPADPDDPHGPEVVVRVVPAAARPAGAEGVIAFGWHDGGVVFVFDDTLAKIDAAISAGLLDADWWVRLLVHERDFHLLREEHTGHRHDRDANPLANELLLAGVVPGRSERPFVPVRDIHGRQGWQSPDLGRKALASLHRAVLVAGRIEGGSTVASGFILWTTGKRAYLVTNQHAVEDQRDLTVTVSTGKGELTVPGAVLDRPSPEQIVEQLVAHNATQGLDRAELLEAVDQLDLAVVVIKHRRLARLGLEPIRLHDSLDGANLQAVTLGYPDPSIPVGPDGTPLSTDTDVLVASGGLTLFGPAGRTGAPHRRFDLIIVGDRAASEGNSGAGVILNVTHPDGHVEDVLIGVSRAQIDSRIGRISKAVRADVVRAFLYAHGLTEPTGSSRGGPARLSGQAQTGDVSSAIADSPVAESVSPARLRALGGQVGVPRRLFRAAGMPGLDAHHGFNRAVVTGTGMDDLVIHSGADGRMHTDTEVWTVLRQLALTHPKIVRALLVHELTHLAHPEWTEEQVQAAAPLPTRWPARLRAAIEGLVEGELQPEADPTAGLLAPIPGVGVRSSSRHGPSGEEEGYDNWEIRELQGLPELPADAGEPVLGWVRLWRAATFELISGERDGPAVTELLEKTGRTPSDLPKLVRHRSWDKLTSDQFKYLDVAGEYRVEVAADGTRELHLFPNLRGDGLEVYALVATHFAAWAGLRPEQVPWVARLAVSGGTGREKLWISSEWIPLRVLADLRSLGSYIDRVTA
ncbi:MAG: trypsin-like peptidase domain-containing protein, partial [Pseudonocardia sp.]|nr:trypsin-like peptidase domain-containing protein [Pseudonocardia sp.]